MVIYYCEECGKKCEAKSKSLTKRFCSHSCANKNRWEKTPRDITTLICQQCGNPFNVPNSDYRMKKGTVKYCSKKCAGEAAKVGELVNCPACGKAFYTTRNKCCSRECARELRKLNYEHKVYTENGYVIEYQNGYNKKGNVKQHRRIMEEHLGRSLKRNEVVHHKNGNRSDNRLENLEVMTAGEHSSLHRKKEKEEGRHLFGGHHNN